MSVDAVELRQRVLLTAHPLQRVGAFVLAALGGVAHPDQLTAPTFNLAVGTMTEDVTRAALIRDTKVDKGFWLKCSLSFFPNSPMNHPSIGKKSDQLIGETVRGWRRVPEDKLWPAAACVLCGQQAVRFFGKMDVALAESDAYRNSTPRGHAGMALCWPCVCTFYALPYGCQLTGGPATALHSWDEDFLRHAVEARVAHNKMAIAVGSADSRQNTAREVVALQALRDYEPNLRSGVELLVFSNNNRGQTLELYSMEQPLAEWLRRTARSTKRRGYQELLAAHRTAEQPGEVGLARSAFRAPQRIVATAVRHLSAKVALDPSPSGIAELAGLCFSYVLEVMRMDQHELDEIKATAGRVAVLLKEDATGGKINEFYANFKDQKRLRGWLQRRAVSWLILPPTDSEGPLVTTRGFELLFDPSIDSQSWFNRQVFLIGVLEQLHQLGWRSKDREKAAQLLKDEFDGDQPGQLDDEEKEGA